MSGPRASKTHQNSTSTSVQDTPELDAVVACRDRPCIDTPADVWSSDRIGGPKDTARRGPRRRSRARRCRNSDLHPMPSTPRMRDVRWLRTHLCEVVHVEGDQTVIRMTCSADWTRLYVAYRSDIRPITTERTCHD